MTPNGEEIKRHDEMFEEMFESQVHDFMEQHKELFEEDLNVFKMAMRFEERYDFVIDQAKKQMEGKIKKTKERNSQIREDILGEKKSRIEEKLKLLQADIDKSLEEHNQICSDQEKKLRNLYDEHRSELVDKIIKELGVEFS